MVHLGYSAMRIAGREKELHILERCFNSGKPEFIAMHGRRRVGKTYLIKQCFSQKKNTIFFFATGTKDALLEEQIANFTDQIGSIFLGGITPQLKKNWNATFKILTDAIKNTPKQKKIVLLFDEFPWMSTKNSRLIQSLDYYWNQHWSMDPRIKLIICGSSASWIINKIVNNTKGLHNRVTQTIRLEPFNLVETKNFLHSAGIKLNHKQITQLYMVMGGIPFYLDKIQKGCSATQLIEELAFQKNSFFISEFNNLFSSLFENHADYIDIVTAIADNRYGISQDKLFQQVPGAIKGIGGLTKLQALKDAGFIASFKPHLNKKKGIYYKVIDEFTLFYLYWIKPIHDTLIQSGLKKGYWDKQHVSPTWKSWSGYAFEAICYKHIFQISDALHLNASAIPTTWRYIPKKESNENGAQIDLLFDRDDDAVSLCEIKYTDAPFKIDKPYAQKLLNKIAVFKKKTKTTKQIFLSVISANGIQPSMYSEELVTGVVVLDDLFN